MNPVVEADWKNRATTLSAHCRFASCMPTTERPHFALPAGHTLQAQCEPRRQPELSLLECGRNGRASSARTATVKNGIDGTGSFADSQRKGRDSRLCPAGNCDPKRIIGTSGRLLTTRFAGTFVWQTLTATAVPVSQSWQTLRSVCRRRPVEEATEQTDKQTINWLFGGQKTFNFVVHRVEPKLGGRFELELVAAGSGLADTVRFASDWHHDAARAIAGHERIAGIFFPVNSIGRHGDIGRPSARPYRRSAAVIERVITAIVFDDLIDGDLNFVVLVGAGREHRLVLHVGPKFQVGRSCQIDRLIAALVHQVPGSIFEPNGWRAKWPGRNRLAIGQANVERALARPLFTIGGSEPLRGVIFLSEHVPGAVVADDHHVFNRVVGVDRIGRIASPLQAIGGGGVPQHSLAIGGSVVARVPHLPTVAIVQNPAAFADFGIPLRRFFGREDRIIHVRSEVNQFRREFIRGCGELNSTWRGQHQANDRVSNSQSCEKRRHQIHSPASHTAYPRCLHRSKSCMESYESLILIGNNIDGFGNLSNTIHSGSSIVGRYSCSIVNSNRKVRRFVARIEALEDRCLLTASTLSAAAGALSNHLLASELQLKTLDGAKPLASASPVGLTPSQIRHAYGFDQILFDGGIVGDGTGQTIAIVDAYHSPSILHDLHVFDVAFGIPDPLSFKQVAQDGSTNFPITDPAGAGAASGTWELETALDVEWAHAIAPGASILLVEGNSSGFNDLVAAAANYARSQPGVVAVSMSFGGSEFSGETSYDQYFTTPSGHGGVTFLAATGDDGQPGGFPAYSSNVVAIGGTTLSTNSDGDYLGESGWSGSGGGVSTVVAQPSYQTGVVTQSTTKRTNPDVAFNADPNSGVAVYDSYDYGSAGWIQVGGTSFATPAWAGLIAIADQGRSLLGLKSLDGRTDTLPTLYELPASYFHDITTGNNGFAAGVGYDLVTGRGSPIANLVVGGLIGSTISGTVFSDTNDNGVLDDGELGLGGWTVFDDANNDGVLNPTAQATAAAADLPIAIPDLKTVTSSITVSGFDGLVSDVNVNLTLHHTFDSDLVITLIAPNGTQVTLASKNGGSANNFISTVFDDQAASSITSAAAPFTGTFRPTGSLATLNGIDPNGVWKLQVADVVRRDSGTLDSWSLQITTGADTAVTTAADGSYQFVGLASGVHHIREIPVDGWTQTSPAGGEFDINVAVGASFKGKDFGNFQPPPPPPPQTTVPPGDFNRDGKLSDDDVPAMLAALTDLAAYQSTNSLSDAALLAIADMDGDGRISNADIQPLLDAVIAIDSQTPPPVGSAAVAGEVLQAHPLAASVPSSSAEVSGQVRNGSLNSALFESAGRNLKRSKTVPRWQCTMSWSTIFKA